MSTKKPIIYIPGLPSLSSDDITLYNRIHAARIDLVTQLSAAGYLVEDIDGQRSWLKNMMQHAEHSNAFLFPAMTSLPEGHPRFQAEAAQRWFEFFSLVTGVHIGNKEKYGEEGIAKPCVIMDPDQQWEPAILLLNDLREKGMFSSMVEDIVHVVRSTDNASAVHALSSALTQGKGKFRRDVPTHYPEDYVFESFRKPMSRHPFGVALFGSASTAEPSYKQGVAELCRLAGMRGWRLTTGAGRYGCMGAADEGFHQGKQLFHQAYPDAPFKPAHVGVSTQAILRLEGPPDELDQLIITNHIYDRMEAMIRGQKASEPTQRARDASKVFFIAPGGTGTLHEFATLMQLATNGSVMKDRKIIVLDFPSHLNPKEGFWKLLISTGKKLGFASSFEVASTPEEAISKADEGYKEWLAIRSEYAQLPHPILNP
ncbi:MAG: hypothetical protein SFT92_05825 [Rickettsiales bacterium]|nr:hypothetical protein [Rickettsiales bacterium]